MTEEEVEVDPVTAALIDLQVAAAAAAEAEQKLRAQVRTVREVGGTWQQVGQALGVAKQTAWEKYWKDAH